MSAIRGELGVFRGSGFSVDSNEQQISALGEELAEMQETLDSLRSEAESTREGVRSLENRVISLRNISQITAYAISIPVLIFVINRVVLYCISETIN
jgi:hypothetical protein